MMDVGPRSTDSTAPRGGRGGKPSTKSVAFATSVAGASMLAAYVGTAPNQATSGDSSAEVGNSAEVVNPPVEEAVADPQDVSVTHPFVGMWVTEDGAIRQELGEDGRYSEARGKRENAYQGSYQIDGSKVTYQDDSGFSADGYFEDGVLFHAGMVLYRIVETTSPPVG